MKKILVLAVSLIMILAFVSCDEGAIINGIDTTGGITATTEGAVSEETEEQPGDSVPDSSDPDTEEITEEISDAETDTIVLDDNSDDIVGKWSMTMDFESVVGTAPTDFSSDAVVAFSAEFRNDGTVGMVIEVKTFMAAFEQYWNDCKTYFTANNYKMLVELMGAESLNKLEETMDMSVDKILEVMEEEFMNMATETLEALGKADGSGKIVSEEKFVLIGNKLYISEEIDSEYLEGDNYYILDMDDDNIYTAYGYNGDDEYKAFAMKKNS